MEKIDEIKSATVKVFINSKNKTNPSYDAGQFQLTIKILK